MRVYNREGETTGTKVSYLYSTTPDKPSAAPDVAVQSSSLIRVEYVFTAGTGGSSVLSYNLQVTDTHSGQYFDVVGDSNTNTNTLMTIYDLQGDNI